MKYEVPDRDNEKVNLVYTKAAELKKARQVVSELEKEIEQIIEENNLQSSFPQAGDKKKEKSTSPRKINVHIKHFRMKMLLKTPVPTDKFFNKVREVMPDLTEQDYNKDIEHYKGNKSIDIKKDCYHWIKK